MAISLVSAAWKEFLRAPTSFAASGGHGERFYLDFRQKQYVPLNEATLTFALNVSGDNQPGSHRALDTGSGGYLFPMSPDDTWTVSMRLRPWCSYTDTDKWAWNWRSPDSLTSLSIGFDAGEFVVKWLLGGSTYEIRGSTSFASDVSLQVWHELTVSFDLSANIGRMWLGSSVESTAWDMAPAPVGTYELPIAQLNAGLAFEIAYVRLFRGELAATADVSDRFKSWYAEEVYFPLDGHGVGRTRCNVTDRVMRYTLTREAEKQETGYCSANTLKLTLNSRQGVFADNQYAAFDPKNRVYNGTSSQKYMQQRCRLIAESWYGTDFDTVFVGRVNEGLFKRKTIIGASRVTIEAEDAAADMARVEDKTNVFEDKKFSDAVPADSLMHLTTRLGTDGEVEQFLSNSSFENATISNSWAVGGTGATLTRDGTRPLIGTYCGKLVYGSATCYAQQSILFTGLRRLNVGEKYTYSIWLEALAAGVSVTLQIFEADSGADNDSTSAVLTVDQNGMRRCSVSHAVTDQASDRLRVRVTLATNTSLFMDCAMLHRGGEPVEWFVLNSADGSAGATAADSMISQKYQTIGFDVDPVSIVHPWMVIEGEPWDAMQDYADATVARYLGFDACGTLRYRTVFKTGYADPPLMNLLDSTWDVATELDDEQTNAVVVRGSRIMKDTNAKEVFNTQDTGDFGLMWAGVAAGALYPNPSTHPDYWAPYEDIVITVKKTRKWWQWHSRKKITRTKRNEKDEEIVGLKTPSLTVNAVRTWGAGNFWNAVACFLTQVLFDASTYQDKCKFVLRNDNAFDAVVFGVTVRGKLVRRLSGTKGIVHDKFVDYDGIRKDGRREYELENNCVITDGQAAKIANYLWKDSAPKRHSYAIPQLGAFGLCVEPGDWQTLTIGGPGEAEYIDSSVRVMRVTVDRQASKIGSTQLELREVQENYVFDSNAFARQLASGRYSPGRMNQKVVASSTYSGPADRYCDGTADDVEWQELIDQLTSMGGGILLATEGTFNFSTQVNAWKNVIIRGSGRGTVIKPSADIYCFRVPGESAHHIEHVQIMDLSLEQYSTYAKPPIYATYVDGLYLEGLFVSGFDRVMQISTVTGLYCRNVKALASGVYGFDIGGASGVLKDCEIDGQMIDTAGRYGFGLGNTGNNLVVEACVAKNLYSTTGQVIGFQCSGRVSLISCRAETLACGSAGQNAQGFNMQGDDARCVDCESKNVEGEKQGLGLQCTGSRNQIIGAKMTDCWGEADESYGVLGFGGISISGAGAIANVVNGCSCYGNGNWIKNGNCEALEGAGPFYAPAIQSEASAPTKSACTWARDNAQKHWGTYSYKFTKTNAAGTAAYVSLADNETTTDMHGLVAGRKYKFGCWAFAPTASGIAAGEVSIEEYRSGAWQAPVSDALSALDVWERLEVEVTLNAATTGVRFRITAASTAALNEYFYTDSFYLRQEDTANEWMTQFRDTGTGTIVT